MPKYNAIVITISVSIGWLDSTESQISKHTCSGPRLIPMISERQAAIIPILGPIFAGVFGLVSFTGKKLSLLHFFWKLFYSLIHFTAATAVEALDLPISSPTSLSEDLITSTYEANNPAATASTGTFSFTVAAHFKATIIRWVRSRKLDL